MFLCGQMLSTKPDCSNADGEARLFKKAHGVGAFLSVMGHCVMTNRNGLVDAREGNQARGTAKRDSALRMARLLNATH